MSQVCAESVNRRRHHAAGFDAEPRLKSDARMTVPLGSLDGPLRRRRVRGQKGNSGQETGFPSQPHVKVPGVLHGLLVGDGEPPKQAGENGLFSRHEAVKPGH